MGTMIVSLLLLGLFLLFFVNINTWVYGLGHSLSMSVYLKDGIDTSTKGKIASSIKKFPSAEIECYISKEEALKTMRSTLGSEAGLLDGLSHNPLPASFEVIFNKVESPETDPHKIVQMLEGLNGVEEVQYSEEWLKRFSDIMDMVRIIGIIIGGLLCACVLLIVINTIKLTIYTRKSEIEILKMVGATDWFVKMPFLFEGLMQGILSGVFSLLFLFSGYLFFFTKKVHILGLAVLDFIFLPHEYMLGILSLSVLLGLSGSYIAVGRFISSDSFNDV